MSKEVFRLDPQAGSQFLDLVHACAAGCDSADAFRNLVRRHVSPLLPHRCSICVLGNLSFAEIMMHQVIAIDYPEPFLSSIPRQLNMREQPAVAKWLVTREPLVIDAESDRRWLSEPELRERSKHGLGRLATHGQIDLSGQMASCFSFAGVDPQMSAAELRHRLVLIAPHLHSAFVAVPGVVAETRPSSFGLTDIEHELLVRLASGKSNSEIASCRSRSPATIRNQLHALYAKLDVCGRAEAVAVAAKLPRQIAVPNFGSNDPWTSGG